MICDFLAGEESGAGEQDVGITSAHMLRVAHELSAEENSLAE